MRPLRLRDLTRQKLSQNTVREQGEPRPKKRKAEAATHTGMHVPVVSFGFTGRATWMFFFGGGGRSGDGRG